MRSCIDHGIFGRFLILWELQKTIESWWKVFLAKSPWSWRVLGQCPMAWGFVSNTFSNVPSGKVTSLWKITVFHGKIHCFYDHVQYLFWHWPEGICCRLDPQDSGVQEGHEKRPPVSHQFSVAFCSEYVMICYTAIPSVKRTVCYWNGMF